MKTWIQKLLLSLFALLACATAIEYKYDKVFRHLSSRLSPPELHLPKWFGKQILFYPSDWIGLFLFATVIWVSRDSLKRLLIERGALLAFCLPLFAALSIAASPLWNYPILYFHLWQYFTACFLFTAASCLKERGEILKVLFVTFAILGAFEAVVAIAQYFSQSSLGLRWLGEPTFHRFDLRGCSAVSSPSGYLWIFDRLFHHPRFAETLIRASGTFSHANMLGGFLVATSLITIAQFGLRKKRALYGAALFLQLTAMALTFSRAALFAFLIGFSLWLFLTLSQKKEGKPALLLVLSCFLIIGFLFQDQIVDRGGIVNYNATARGSDAYRVKYQAIAFDMILKKPLFGVGHEQFMMRLPEFLPPAANPADHFGAVHNSYLMLASETGLLSLFSYLALIALVVWIGFKNRTDPAMPCLLSIFVGFLFIGGCDLYLLTFQSGRLLFFLIAGLIASHRALKPAASRVLA